MLGVQSLIAVGSCDMPPPGTACLPRGPVGSLTMSTYRPCMHKDNSIPLGRLVRDHILLVPSIYQKYGMSQYQAQVFF